MVILTECPGLSPEEVETLVTQPSKPHFWLFGVQAVRSQSSMGLTAIHAEFDWHNGQPGTARQVVQERLATLTGVLPEGIRPQMTPPTSIMGQIMHVGLYRRKGPKGGDLFPLGKTGLMVERSLKHGDTSISVWRPRVCDNPATWERVDVDRILGSGSPKAKNAVAVSKFFLRGRTMKRSCACYSSSWTYEPLRTGRFDLGYCRCLELPRCC